MRPSPLRLADFEVLTFDCYGTLIDWEGGLFAALQPLLSRVPQAPGRDAVLERFARLESTQQVRTPGMIYSALLAEVHGQLAAELRVQPVPGESEAFGASVPDWPAFPDSAPALAYLKQHYRLVVLSNVDRTSFAGSNRRLGVEFDAVYTAEDIGSYKPDPANFTYMLDRVGVPKSAILHTAQSLFHDHVPAKAAGLVTAWIDRRHTEGGWGATTPVEGAGYDMRFESLGAMAEAHRAENAGG